MRQAYAKCVPWRFHRNERATNAGRSFEISYRLKESECPPVSNLLIICRLRPRWSRCTECPWQSSTTVFRGFL